MRKTRIESFSCVICGGCDYLDIDYSYPNMKTHSKFPSVHVYTNKICGTCCSVHTYPKITDEKLVAFYNGDYRRSEFSIEIDGRIIEPPIQIPWSGMSFSRFKNFYECYSNESTRSQGFSLDANSHVLDLGAYQGMFLYAMREVFSCSCVACDYSKAGIEFAKNAFGFAESKVTRNIEEETFDRKFNLVTMVHAFEHIRDPLKLLRNIRDNVLEPNGLLYLEVPNSLVYPLDDPTHLIMYSAKSLEYVLSKAGYKVVCLVESGYGCQGFINYTSRQNLCCLAYPLRNENEAVIKSIDSERFYYSLKRNQRITSLISFINGFKKLIYPFNKMLSKVF